MDSMWRSEVPTYSIQLRLSASEPRHKLRNVHEGILFCFYYITLVAADAAYLFIIFRDQFCEKIIIVSTRFWKWVSERQNNISDPLAFRFHSSGISD
jgi:hypothetical protein